MTHEKYDSIIKRLRSLVPPGYESTRSYDMQRRILNSELKTLGLRTPDIKAAARAVPLCDRIEVLDGFFAERDHTYDSVLFCVLPCRQKRELQRDARPS